MDSFKGFVTQLLDVSRYLSLPDYLVLICLFLVILLFFLMSVAMRFYASIASVFFLLSLTLLFASPFVYQGIMESYIKQAVLTLTYNESLQYDNVYFVEGVISNVGLLDFRGCSVRVNFIPKNLKKIDTIKYKLKPRFEFVKDYAIPLSKLDSMDFKIVIPSPNPQIQYDLQTRATCY